MAPIPTKNEAVGNLIKAMKIEAASGTTLHLGGQFWRFATSSGVHCSEPVKAAKLWVDFLFGEAKAKLIATTVEEQGSCATINSVKQAYNAKLGYVAPKKIKVDSKKEAKVFTVKAKLKVKEEKPVKKEKFTKKDDTVLQLLRNMEEKLYRLDHVNSSIEDYTRKF